MLADPFLAVNQGSGGVEPDSQCNNGKQRQEENQPQDRNGDVDNPLDQQLAGTQNLWIDRNQRKTVDLVDPHLAADDVIHAWQDLDPHRHILQLGDHIQ